MAAVSNALNAETSQPQERADQHLPPRSYAAAVLDSNTPENDAATAEKSQQDLNGVVTDGSSSTTASNVNGFPPASGTNGTKTPKQEDKVVYEKHVDSNGTMLTSVKSNRDYDAGLKHDEATAPRERKKPSKSQKKQDIPKSQLESGRRAGAGWERSAIRWAPLNVPMQRRLQTLVVLWHSICIAAFLSSFLALCAIPLAWPLLIPYLIYTLVFSNEATSGTLSRRSEWMRRSKIWSLFAGYFPARLHRTVELVPTRKYIFGYHPHGIISHGAFASFGTEALGFSDLFPGITNTLLTLDNNFRIPFYRDYALALGLASVSRESIENLLSTGGFNNEGMGRAVTIVVGGARESLNAQPHNLRLVLNSRKGFVKLAIRMGADLVPTLAFGENELYDQVDSKEHPWIHQFQLVVKKLIGFTIPLFHARGVFNYDVGMMPYRRAVNIVVGRPVKVVQQGGKDGAVDPDYLNQVHKEYVDELLRLWNTHKDTFAKDREGELEIIE